MKKFLSTIIISIIIIMSIYAPVKAANEEKTQLRLTVLEADEEYELFMLLPKKYINYAIHYDGLDIKYESENTLIYNTIPSIPVDKNNVQDETYIENGIEYVQIKLDDLGGEEYLFEIIAEYTDMDMVYRLQSKSRDNIMIIENFKVQDNVCRIEYNYQENTIKTERVNEFKFNFKISWWQIVIISLLVICMMFLNKRRYY